VVGLGFGAARQAKIDQLRFAFGVEENVAGLDVAVEQPVFQGGVEGGRHLDANIEDLQLGQPAIPLNAIVQAAAVRQFHDQETLVLVFLEGVNVDDIRMIQGSRRTGLAGKTLQRLGVVQEFLLHQLHGHFALEGQIESAEDRAHAPGGDGITQLELPQPHRHHEGMAAAGARRGRQGRQIARDEHFGAASPTTYHPQGLANAIRCYGHGVSLASTVPRTSVLNSKPPRGDFLLTRHAVSLACADGTRGASPNPWMILPFLGLLGMIALAPLFLPHWWHRHYPKVAYAFGP
jgi:hypothetical protein